MRGNWNQIHTYFLPDNGGPPVYLNPDGTPGMAPMLSAEEFNAQQIADLVSYMSSLRGAGL